MQVNQPHIFSSALTGIDRVLVKRITQLHSGLLILLQEMKTN